MSERFSFFDNFQLKSTIFLLSKILTPASNSALVTLEADSGPGERLGWLGEVLGENVCKINEVKICVKINEVIKYLEPRPRRGCHVRVPLLGSASGNQG